MHEIKRREMQKTCKYEFGRNKLTISHTVTPNFIGRFVQQTMYNATQESFFSEEEALCTVVFYLHQQVPLLLSLVSSLAKVLFKQNIKILYVV
jgi:hypothetical protein